jgi:hypothetical protein
MGAAENIAVHIAWSEANDRHDLSAYEEYMHEDIEVEHLDGGTVVGREAVRRNMADSIAAMPDRRVVVEDRFATDDRVVCRWRVTGVPTGEGGEPAQGIDVAGVSVWEFRDGRASRGWVCSNAAFLAGAAHKYSVGAHDE